MNYPSIISFEKIDGRRIQLNPTPTFGILVPESIGTDEYDLNEFMKLGYRAIMYWLKFRI
jgi:hypothetical protein